jgi:signal transduction histidine kinase
VVITDQWGFLIASSYDINSPSLADRQWFKSSFQNGKGGYYLSNIYFNEEKKDYYYDVAVPIREPKFQEVLGVLKLGIRRDKLLKAIIEVKIGKTGHAMLVSSLGNPMICPILPPGDHIINKPLMAQISQPHAAWAVAKDDAHGGKQSIVGFAPIQFARPLTSSSLNQTQWYTFIRQHPDETYSPVYNLLFKVGVQGFGLVFVISFLGFLAGQRIVKPILLLKKRAQSIGQASYELATQENPTHSNLKLKERINIQTGDEIEELSQAFNQMSLALEENLQTIKKQQKELAQKEKLASVGQLLAGLTHDLKNPLGVIRSSAQILMGNEESEQVKKEMGRYIIEEVDRLTFRINDFLRFARHRLPEQREIQIQKVVEETLKQWGSQGGILNKITVHKKIDPSLPSVFVDPEQLNEILFNLLNNAREAMPQGGTITLRAERNGNDKVVTSIQDTGEGISPEDLDKIFDPFFTQKQYGIGLGLTNVKRLTEDNGGQVLVHSKTGQGSTFSLHFPVVQSSSQDQE